MNKHNYTQTKKLAEYTTTHYFKWLESAIALRTHLVRFEELQNKPDDDPITQRYLQEIHANVICRHCHQEAPYYPESAFIYGEDHGAVFYCGCKPGGVYVNCHKNDVAGNLRTTNRQRIPMGMLADRTLRKQRQALHVVFDAMWDKHITRLAKAQPDIMPYNVRSLAYKLLAVEMGIKDVRFCHIAWFNTNQCRKAMRVCKGNGIQKLFEIMRKVYTLPSDIKDEAHISCYMDNFHDEVMEGFFRQQRVMRKNKSPRKKRSRK